MDAEWPLAQCRRRHVTADDRHIVDAIYGGYVLKHADLDELLDSMPSAAGSGDCPLDQHGNLDVDWGLRFSGTRHRCPPIRGCEVGWATTFGG